MKREKAPKLCEDCLGIEQNHPEYPLQEKGQSGGNESSKKKTVSFAEDKVLTWSTSTSGSLEPTILARTMPTYLQLFFEMMIFRNSIRGGRYQSTCVFPTSSSSWWNAKPFYRNAEPQRWPAKHLGHAWFFGKRFCKSSCVFYSTLSAGIESMEFGHIRTDPLINGGEE